MKNKRFLAILMALACALCVAGLSACGGSADPNVSDEDLIKADCEKVVGTYISPEEMLDALRADDQIAEYEALGLDVESYAQNMSNIFKFAVNSVEVDGDTAVAKCVLTVPNYGSEMQESIEAAIMEAAETTDVASMTEDEQMALIMGIMNDVISDPNFPTEDTDIDIDYVKEGGSWKMKDAESIEENLTRLGTAAAGL